MRPLLPTLALFVAVDVLAAPAVPPIDLSAPLPPIAAQYSTQREFISAGGSNAQAKIEWRLFRDNDSVEIEDLATQTGELWQHDGTTLFFRKLFHHEQRAVEYRMDDFAVLEIKPNWPQPALLIDPKILLALMQQESEQEAAQPQSSQQPFTKQPSTKQFAIKKTSIKEKEGWRDGYQFRHLQGRIDTSNYDIIWRTDINLPAQIIVSNGVRRETTVLMATQSLAAGTWPRHDLLHYDMIDFADLGDRESDPFIARVAALLPGTHEQYPH
ncbi:MAG: hypothetical protein JWM78_144 [Verrucomicrobiaceae bacterium]|nr:hypothetical protein [Verrucomicrobiaceae bacterium]